MGDAWLDLGPLKQSGNEVLGTGVRQHKRILCQVLKGNRFILRQGMVLWQDGNELIDGEWVGIELGLWERHNADLNALLMQILLDLCIGLFGDVHVDPGVSRVELLQQGRQ